MVTSLTFRSQNTFIQRAVKSIVGRDIIKELHDTKAENKNLRNELKQARANTSVALNRTTAQEFQAIRDEHKKLRQDLERVPVQVLNAVAGTSPAAKMMEGEIEDGKDFEEQKTQTEADPQRSIAELANRETKLKGSVNQLLQQEVTLKADVEFEQRRFDSLNKARTVLHNRQSGAVAFTSSSDFRKLIDYGKTEVHLEHIMQHYFPEMAENKTLTLEDQVKVRIGTISASSLRRSFSISMQRTRNLQFKLAESWKLVSACSLFARVRSTVQGQRPQSCWRLRGDYFTMLVNASASD